MNRDWSEETQWRCACAYLAGPRRDWSGSGCRCRCAGISNRSCEPGHCDCRWSDGSAVRCDLAWWCQRGATLRMRSLITHGWSRWRAGRCPRRIWLNVLWVSPVLIHRGAGRACSLQRRASRSRSSSILYRLYAGREGRAHSSAARWASKRFTRLSWSNFAFRPKSNARCPLGAAA